MAHTCRRCGGQFEAGEVTIVNPRDVIGPSRYDEALARDNDNDPGTTSDTFLTEAEKVLYSRSDAERTYCNQCYYLCHDRGHNIWECGVRHPANDDEPLPVTSGVAGDPGDEDP